MASCTLVLEDTGDSPKKKKQPKAIPPTGWIYSDVDGTKTQKKMAILAAVLLREERVLKIQNPHFDLRKSK